MNNEPEEKPNGLKLDDIASTILLIVVALAPLSFLSETSIRDGNTHKHMNPAELFKHIADGDEDVIKTFIAAFLHEGFYQPLPPLSK